MGHPLLLYDGVCGFCNRSVRFVLKRDRGLFRFASLQSAVARRLLTRHGVNASELDAAYVVLGYDPDRPGGETLLTRSDAALFVGQQLGGVWSAAAFVIRALPWTFREWAYGLIARNRYHVFGRYETCPLPDEKIRARFLDL